MRRGGVTFCCLPAARRSNFGALITVIARRRLTPIGLDWGHKSAAQKLPAILAIGSGPPSGQGALNSLSNCKFDES